MIGALLKRIGQAVGKVTKEPLRGVALAYPSSNRSSSSRRRRSSSTGATR